MFILNNSVIMSKISWYRLGCIIIKTGVFLTPQGISLEMYKNIRHNNTRRSMAVFTYTISVFRVLHFLHLLMNPCVPTSVRTIDLNIRLFVAVCKLLKNNTLKKKIQSDFKNFVHTLNFIPNSPTLKTFLKHVVKVHQHFIIETLNALLKKYV